MEIEAKFVLNTKEDFERAVALFAPAGAEDSVLENHFFDGPTKQLQNAGIMMRLRLKGDTKAEITLKTHTEVEQGSACRFLDSNASIPVETARAAINSPATLAATPDMQDVMQKYQMSTLKYLGGFRTNRKTCKTTFSGVQMTVKLDEVLFQFGTHYEVEIVCDESLPAHDVILEVQNVLASNGISGIRGTQNKFQTFIKGCEEAMIAPTSFAG